MYILISFKK